MWRLREVQTEDAADVAVLEKEIFLDPWTENGLRDTLLGNNAAALGIWKDQELVGYVILYYVLDEGEIARIAVSSSNRRQGAAGRLLEGIHQICRDKGIVRLMLEVRRSNRAAIAFYRKYGFTEDGVRKGYYANPKEDALLMSKRLDVM